MAKTVADLKSNDKLIDEAVETFTALSEVKGMIVADVLAAQDDETQTIITKIAAVLHSRLADGIRLSVGRSKVDAVVSEEALNKTILWMATELVKDLALVGLRVGNFQFPADACAVCGGDV